MSDSLHLSFRCAFNASERWLHDVPFRVTHAAPAFSRYTFMARLGMRVHIGVNCATPERRLKADKISSSTLQQCTWRV
jgi:hypothetical protein